MTITTKDIIKILPFQEAFKIDFLEKFDTLPSDKKFSVEQILWDAYYALYRLKFDANISLAFERAKNNEETLDKDFYKRVEEQTEKEMETQALESTEKVDLESARKAMELIVKEMHAAKT